MEKENTPQVNPIGDEMYYKILHKPAVKDELPKLNGVREFTVNHLFANVWSRSKDESETDKINLRERRLITIALLAAQGFGDQLKDHARGAFFSKINENELNEVMIHVAHYAGWAAGTNGQRLIHEAYLEYLKE